MTSCIWIIDYPSCRNRSTSESCGPSIVLPHDRTVKDGKKSGELRPICAAGLRRAGFEKLQEHQRKQPLAHVGGGSGMVSPLSCHTESIQRQRQGCLRAAAQGGGKPENRLVVKLHQLVKTRGQDRLHIHRRNAVPATVRQ